MLDKEFFATQLGELAAYFKRDMTPLVHRVFYKNLQQLTEAEFEKAVETAIARCNFMPTPEQLAEFGNGGNKARILEQWERIDQGRKAFPTAPSVTKEYDQLMSSLNLDPVALKVLKVLGGLSALSRLGDQDIKWTRDRFIEYYQLWDSQREQLEVEAQEVKALAAAVEKLALPPSSVEPMPAEVKLVMQSLVEKTTEEVVQKMTMPEPAKGVRTAEEYQAIAEETIRLWRVNGQLVEEF